MNGQIQKIINTLNNSNEQKYNDIKILIQKYNNLKADKDNLISKETQTISKNIASIKNKIKTNNDEINLLINELNSIQLENVNNVNNIETNNNIWIFPTFNNNISNSDKLILDRYNSNYKPFYSIESLQIHKIYYRQQIKNELIASRKSSKKYYSQLKLLNKQLELAINENNNYKLDLISQRQLAQQINNLDILKLKATDNLNILTTIKNIKKSNINVIQIQRNIDALNSKIQKENKAFKENNKTNTNKILKSKEYNKILVIDTASHNNFINKIKVKIIKDKIKQIDICKEIILARKEENKNLENDIIVEESLLVNYTNETQNMIKYYDKEIDMMSKKINKLYNFL